MAQVAGFAWNTLDISDFPTRHNYGLGLWQNHIERILAAWLVYAVPHFVFHVTQVHSFSLADNLAQLSSLGFQVLLSLVLLALTKMRGTPVRTPAVRGG